MYSKREEFLCYLKEVKALSENSIIAYDNDLTRFAKDMSQADVKNIAYANGADLTSYVVNLVEAGNLKSTLSRRISSIRIYYKFLFEKGYISNNPTKTFKMPHISEENAECLSYEEIDKLLSVPAVGPSEKRDVAILELLYATGLKVLEVVDLDIMDINLDMGFVTCKSNFAKARIVPINASANIAIKTYIDDARQFFLDRRNKRKGKVVLEEALFLNTHGSRLTRQGLWNIVKNTGEKAGLDRMVSCHLIRSTFAVHMLENGADLHSMVDMLGFEETSSLNAYIGAVKHRLKDVYDKAHPRMNRQAKEVIF
jgi:integrase/recombinase XerD